MPKDKSAQFHYEGFSFPNTTPVPDDVFDKIMSHLTGAELKVLLYICRRTFGFKKQSDDISFNQICTGITKRDGEVLDQGTGLSTSTAQAAIKGLIDKGIITASKRSSKERGNEPTTYCLNIVDPYGENRHRGIPKIDIALYRKSPTQETVLQETVLQQSNSRANKEKGREENHNSAPNNKARFTRSPRNGETPDEGGDSYNAGKTGEIEPSQEKSVQSRKRNLHRNREEEGIVNNFSNPATNRGLQPLAAALPMFAPEEPEINYTDARQAIQMYIADFGREFNDQASVRSSGTRALNLMKRSGVSLETFISKMYQARGVTQESTASIHNKSGQVKAKMPYWFSVLEELLGLAEEKD